MKINNSGNDELELVWEGFAQVALLEQVCHGGAVAPWPIGLPRTRPARQEGLARYRQSLDLGWQASQITRTETDDYVFATNLGQSQLAASHLGQWIARRSSSRHLPVAQQAMLSVGIQLSELINSSAECAAAEIRVIIPPPSPPVRGWHGMLQMLFNEDPDV